MNAVLNGLPVALEHNQVTAIANDPVVVFYQPINEGSGLGILSFVVKVGSEDISLLGTRDVLQYPEVVGSLYHFSLHQNGDDALAVVIHDGLWKIPALPFEYHSFRSLRSIEDLGPSAVNVTQTMNLITSRFSGATVRVYITGE